jgi:DNA-binding beta-propeller fold protein YncE
MIASLDSGYVKAQLTLTPAAVAAHWDLTTFASGFTPTGSGYNGVGPLGITFREDGGVVVADHDDGSVRVFPTDADDQHASNAPIGQIYGFGNADSMA